MDELEAAVRGLIARKAKHAKKGTVMGEETWMELYSHLMEEVDELTLSDCEEDALEELGDILGILVHAILKYGFTIEDVVQRELLKLKERFP